MTDKERIDLVEGAMLEDTEYARHSMIQRGCSVFANISESMFH